MLSVMLVSDEAGDINIQHSLKPVIGIPIESGGLGGLDSLLSTAQMPPGIPIIVQAISTLVLS